MHYRNVLDQNGRNQQKGALKNEYCKKGINRKNVSQKIQQIGLKGI